MDLLTAYGTRAADAKRLTCTVSIGNGRYVLRTVVDHAGPVLHSSPRHPCKGVVLFLAGLGSTKEKLAASKRRDIFQAEGWAWVCADHYNEGERRDTSAETLSNRAGWSRSQKAHFWPAIHRTAVTVPLLVDFAMVTYSASNVVAYGSSMGGDIFLASLCMEQRLRALVAERSTPDWLRPDSTANVLGEDADGDALYRTHAPCNRPEMYVGHPTAVLFIVGESDSHVPKAGAERFIESLRTMGADRKMMQSVTMPSGGWEGHILKDAEEATRLALEWFGSPGELLIGFKLPPPSASPSE